MHSNHVTGDDKASRIKRTLTAVLATAFMMVGATFTTPRVQAQEILPPPICPPNQQLIFIVSGGIIIPVCVNDPP